MNYFLVAAKEFGLPIKVLKKALRKHEVRFDVRKPDARDRIAGLSSEYKFVYIDGRQRARGERVVDLATAELKKLRARARRHPSPWPSTREYEAFTV